MAKRNRIRRVLKWAGLVACLAIVGLFALSIRYALTWAWVERDYVFMAGIVAIITAKNPSKQIGYSVREMTPFGGHVYTRLRYMRWWPSMQSQGSIRRIDVPLWIPFILLAIPTYMLWRRDRRKPEGCCQNCGYDLTGNESGVCPECGIQIDAQTNTE